MCQVQLWYSCLDIFLKRSLFVPVNIGHHKSAALEEKSWHKWITICRKRQTHLSLKRRRAKVGDVHKILAKHKSWKPKLVKVDLNVHLDPWWDKERDQGRGRRRWRWRGRRGGEGRWRRKKARVPLEVLLLLLLKQIYLEVNMWWILEVI